jgi:hypothetical protein
MKTFKKALLILSFSIGISNLKSSYAQQPQTSQTAVTVPAASSAPILTNEKKAGGSGKDSSQITPVVTDRKTPGSVRATLDGRKIKEQRADSQVSPVFDKNKKIENKKND